MTRRAVVPVQQRMLRIARHLLEGGTITTHWIRRTFDVGRGPAERDMRLVRFYLPVQQLTRRGLDGKRRGTCGYKALKLIQRRRR